jgi:hypothetical protein
MYAGTRRGQECRQVYGQYHLRLAAGLTRRRKANERIKSVTTLRTVNPHGTAWLRKNAA